MLDINSRNDWRRLRYEYYTGARTAHICANYRISGILFGYAIETSLKHALRETGFSHPGVLHCHDIAKLIQNVKSCSVFNNLHVSEDFIRYIDDSFKPRYPILQAEVVENATLDNLFLLTSIDYVSYYDDFFIQIDDAIFAYTNDVQATVALDALAELNTYNGRVFFHGNYLACAKLDEYLSRGISSRMSQESLAELDKGIEHLWNCRFMYQFDTRKPEKPADWHPAADFEYPHWIEKGGNKYIKIRLPHNSGPGSQRSFVRDTE